jgi:hypothetical protein
VPGFFEVRRIEYAEALNVLADNQGADDVLVLVSEQGSPVDSIVAEFRGELGPLNVRDRTRGELTRAEGEPTTWVGTATFRVACGTVEVAAEQVQSVGVLAEQALVFELHGVTLEVRGLRIE